MEVDQAQAGAGGAGRIRLSGRRQRKWAALGLLMLVGLFNYVDRLSMSILQVPIKAELGLSDTQIGVLTGLAFSLVYTTMSIPLAHLADRVSRKAVVVAALFVWSAMTAACGLASGFAMLILFRMGVAIGEAGCVPASHAMISDFFAFAERARALAIYGLVFPLGTLLGFGASGWMNESFGWRQTFVILGILGMVLAPVVMAFLREPERGASERYTPVSEGRGVNALSLPQALAQLLRTPAFSYLLVGASLLSYPLHATMVWSPAFYDRSFAMPLAELSLYLALLTGGAGAFGLYACGALADRLGQSDRRWYMWVPAWSGVLLAPCIFLQYLVAPTAYISFALGIPTVVLMNAFLAPMMAMTQALAAPQLRALASACVVCVAGFVGTVLGPLITGLISDAILVHAEAGQESLRYAILTSTVPALMGSILLLRGAQHLPVDLARLHGESREQQSGVAVSPASPG